MSLSSQGFAIVENVCTLAECDAVTGRLHGMPTVGSRRMLDQAWRRELAEQLCARLSPAIPELAALAAAQCTYFNKSPAGNWLVAFHQDRSVPAAPSTGAEGLSGRSNKEGKAFVHCADSLLERLLAVRLHLDDSTSDNGPLRVIPGSHRAGTLSPERIQAARASSAERALTVRRGGVILMRPLLLHASSKSRVSAERRVLHFLFGPPLPW